MFFRKGTAADIPAVAEIYDHIHRKEQNGEVTIGWDPAIYPVRSTAEEALERGDLYVCEEDGQLLAAGIINKLQVDVYAGANWAFQAEDDDVLVLHTLVVDPDTGKKGVGTAFAGFYEEQARELGCKVLRIDTNVKNTIARSLYKKLGYREADIVHCTFNGLRSIDLVLLEKKL